MIRLGLTGSIGMGKSTAASMLKRLGLPLHDADLTVHRLLGPKGEAVAAVAAAFPGTARGQAIDRQALARAVAGDRAKLTLLENILHPLVRRAEQRFLRRCRAARRPLVVLDIPLLYETGGEGRCDKVIAVSAPRATQLARVLRRPGMTRDWLAFVESRQMPDAEKRRRADFVVGTGLGKRESLQRLKRIVRLLMQRPIDRTGER